jgi:sec-independent protein translocase protein TatB
VELFGIGPLELIFIILLALIIFGPKDLEKAGRTIGRSLYKFINSDTWRTLTRTSQKIKTFPNDLIRQAQQEILQEKVDNGAVKSEEWKMDPRSQPAAGKPPATQPPAVPAPAPEEPPSILPPANQPPSE